MTIFQKAGKSPAVGSPLDCGLTECQGKPQCVRCRRMADMDAICALLPEGVHLGAPLTPELLRELMPRQVQNEFGHLLTTDALWQMYTE